LTRIILFPISRKGIKSQTALKELQPKIKKLQKESKNKEEQAQQMMKLYKENKINPVSGCLPLLIQFPILIALYQALMVILRNSKDFSTILYSFVQNPGVLGTSFLGIIDLSVPSIFLAILTGLFQFIQNKLMLKSTPKMQTSGQKMNIQKTMSSQMTYFMPFIIIFISLRLPAGLPLYWAFSTLFGIGEYLLTNRKKINPASLPGDAK